jgi:hypothetical protein
MAEGMHIKKMTATFTEFRVVDIPEWALLRGLTLWLTISNLSILALLVTRSTMYAMVQLN